jgi:hypothetical protein
MDPQSHCLKCSPKHGARAWCEGPRGKRYARFRLEESKKCLTTNRPQVEAPTTRMSSAKTLLDGGGIQTNVQHFLVVCS